MCRNELSYKVIRSLVNLSHRPSLSLFAQRELMPLQLNTDTGKYFVVARFDGELGN